MGRVTSVAILYLKVCPMLGRPASPLIFFCSSSRGYLSFDTSTSSLLFLSNGSGFTRLGIEVRWQVVLHGVCTSLRLILGDCSRLMLYFHMFLRIRLRSINWCIVCMFISMCACAILTFLLCDM